ncbi:MAG TPA: hypothetical protein VFI42_19790, partial [Thermomicrobiaceae bacterium]|nr:hypothetical protein [Thermomicrobiaceae bacterium]
MSEYQYYEFQALDRRLTPEEMAELRQISTRAQITPTRFQNVYNYGDFRGNPVELMKGYFDAFLYLANWGTHQLMLRLPAAVLDLDLVRRYASQLTLERHQAGKDIILEFTAGAEGGDCEWMVDQESAAWLAALIPL